MILPGRSIARIWLARGALLFAMSSTVFLTSAKAVLIAGPDGSINTTAPVPDPGFLNVGDRTGLTGVYVRNGWVLTANHVGLGPIVLDGVTYQAVPGSNVRIMNPISPHPDLIAFKLTTHPPLPDLMLPSSPIALNDDVIFIGQGTNRGTAVSPPWMAPSGNTYDGWNLGTGRAFRWGTNVVDAVNLTILDTTSFAALFDDLPGQMSNLPEAQVVNGDSGGAAFRWTGGTPELVGILFARGFTEDQSTQPTSLALFDNFSVVADLEHYGAQVAGIIDQPDCDDGIDEDGDGLTDFPADPGCSDLLDTSERSAALECDNGNDDDMDGLIDFPEDDGCDDPLDPSEVPEPRFVAMLAAGGLLLSAFRPPCPRPNGAVEDR